MPPATPAPRTASSPLEHSGLADPCDLPKPSNLPELPDHSDLVGFSELTESPRHLGLPDEQVTALALAARTGTPTTVEAFVRAVYPDVRRFVTHLAGPHAAEDLTQETFVRVLLALPRFAGRSSARTWLLSIARRVVIDRFRSAARRPLLADLADWQSAAERHQPLGLPGREDGVALADLLSRVPRERREAFVLTQLAGVPYGEAAELIGCPIGTVRSRVARARSQLIASLTA
ncbi:sigma-70 family RNA polymerase sigma factor [Streptosporangium saharense]|uniref:RNA polymerase sigma factor n=1 Tax=Streptosporangium saharense TaxID=1706840 RepID=A0A7W7VMX0_9ACTN|nr:sigma-70 family RNA polymerase sigma factor [Streptosporangium saharense]MBB4915660.1 RNA polymerase sigma-70 factor (ECF subfamily) [Streptosporangium saharense]